MAATTRAQFLANNPAFAKMSAKERDTWLKNHPDAAAIWRRLTDGDPSNNNPGAAPAPAAPAPAAPAAPVNYDVPTPVWDPVAAPAAPTYLPYFGDLDQEEADEDAQFNVFSNDTEAQRNNAMLQWTQADRDINEAAPALYRRILNSSAARGMAYSTGQATQDSEARSSVARSLSDILTQRNTTFANLDAALATARGNRENSRARRAQRRAARAAGNPYA